MFGFGQYNDRENSDNDNPSIRNSLDMAKFHIAQNKQIPNELKDTILKYNAEDAGYEISLLGGDEDLVVEIDMIQSYIRGDFKKRKDGRYVWGGLLLDKNQNPKDLIIKHFPMSSSEIIE